MKKLLLLSAGAAAFGLAACGSGGGGGSGTTGSTAPLAASDATTVSLQFGEMGLDVSLASPDSKGTGFVIANASKRTLDVASLSGASLAALNAASRPTGANDFASVKTNGISGFADATLQFTTSDGSATGLQLKVHYYRPVSDINNVTTDATYTFVFTKYDAATNPYGVYGPGDLSYVRNDLGASYQQRKNIVFNALDATAKLGIADYDASGWLPIGDDTYKFTGSYNGGGFTIDKLHLSRPSTDNQGLFGTTSGSASITKLGLTNLDVKGNNNTGGLVGYQYSGSISQAYASGAVSSASGGAVGGLVGLQSGSISQAYATGAVSSASGGAVGGLVGLQSGSISQAYATGDVSSTSGNYLGGLVGWQWGSIAQAYATGDVSSASGNYLGGLVGYQAGSISQAYATGLVTVSSAVHTVGGLVGKQGSGTLTSTYYKKHDGYTYTGVGGDATGGIADATSGAKAVTTGATDLSFAGFIWTDAPADATPANHIWTRTGAVSGGAKGNWPVFGGAWLTGWGDTTPATQTLQSLP